MKSRFTAFVAFGYDRVGREIGAQIIAILERHRVTCLTADTPEARAITDKVREQIHSSNALVALVHRGKNDQTSRWVDQEIGYALGCNKLVLWLVEKGLDIRGIEGNLEFLEFTHRNGKLLGVSNLRNRLGHYLKDATVSLTQSPPNFPDYVYSTANAVQFTEVLKKTQYQMIASGMGLQPIADLCTPNIVEKLLKEKEFKAHIVLSSPRADASQERALDEVDDPRHAAKDVAKIALRYLTDKRLAHALRSGRLRIEFSSGYPTLAVATFDYRLYAYFYAYKMRGTASPVLQFEDYRSNSSGQFFRNHLMAVLADAKPISLKHLQVIHGGSSR